MNTNNPTDQTEFVNPSKDAIVFAIPFAEMEAITSDWLMSEFGVYDDEKRQRATMHVSYRVYNLTPRWWITKERSVSQLVVHLTGIAANQTRFRVEYLHCYAGKEAQGEQEKRDFIAAYVAHIHEVHPALQDDQQRRAGARDPGSAAMQTIKSVVALNERPELLPRLDPEPGRAVIWHNLQGNPEGDALPIHFWALKFLMDVDAPTLYFVLCEWLEGLKRQGAAFVIPVASGARWHLQTHWLLKSESDDGMKRLM